MGGLHSLKADPSARANDQHSRYGVDAPGLVRSPSCAMPATIPPDCKCIAGNLECATQDLVHTARLIGLSDTVFAEPSLRYE
jgi:hypothetical protein